jgi:hypothetical protein
MSRVLLSVVTTITTDIDVTSTMDGDSNVCVVPAVVGALLLLVSLMLLASLLLMC